MKFVFEEKPSDSPLVDSIWQTRGEEDGTFLSTAGTSWQIVLWRYRGETNITVRGPETKASIAESAAGAEYLGITFKQGAYMPHLPVHKLVDHEITFPASADKRFWLHGASWELPNFDNIDTFIEKLVHDNLLVCDPVVNAVLQEQPHDAAWRTVRHHFLRATGLSQNNIFQIERARQSMALLEQGTPILDVVFQQGYADQPHLTRALKRFMGKTPAQISRASQP